MMYRGILMPFSSDGDGDRLHLRRHQLEGDGRRRHPGDADRSSRRCAEGRARPPRRRRSGPMGRARCDDRGPRRATDRSLGARLATARTQRRRGRRDRGPQPQRAYTMRWARPTRLRWPPPPIPTATKPSRAASGMTVQARAPMTAIAKLVFGATADKARLTEYAAVLAHAARTGVPGDALDAISGRDRRRDEGAGRRRTRARRAGHADAAAPDHDRPGRSQAGAGNSPACRSSASEGYVLLLGRIAGDDSRNRRRRDRDRTAGHGPSAAPPNSRARLCCTATSLEKLSRPA